MLTSITDILNQKFNKDFFAQPSMERINTIHDSPGSAQTLEKIARMTLLSDQIPQLRVFRMEALKAGVVIAQLRRLEANANWEQRPPLPLPTLVNPFGYGDSSDYAGCYDRVADELHFCMEDFVDKNTKDTGMAASQRRLFNLLGAFALIPETITQHYFENQSERQLARRKHLDGILKEHAFFELDEQFVGMDFLKDHVWKLKKSRDFRNDFAHAQDGDDTISMHMAFAADRGMGKTTVVQALAPAMHRLGLLEKNKVTKLSLSSISAPTLGAEEKAVRDAFESGRGGLVFFDEVDTAAGHISASQKRSSVSQVINELAETMRAHTCLIVATYPKNMPFFLNSDDGLRSRFGNRIIEFPTPPTMNFVTMYERKMAMSGFYLADDQTRSILWDKISSMRKVEDRSFGNGRTIREMVQFTEAYLADRGGRRQIDAADMKKITAEFNLMTKPEPLNVFTEENPFRQQAALSSQKEPAAVVVPFKQSGPALSRD